MRIDGKTYKFQEVSRILTVPDCNVLGPNKLGTGNGEAKFYFGSKSDLHSFVLGASTIDCFFLKSDLLKYMQIAEKEYKFPTQNYAGKSKMPELWEERVQSLLKMPDIIEFKVHVQTQIAGPRGYINSNDLAYKLFRTLSLPLISYISIMRLSDPKGAIRYYWKLFVDFDALKQRGLTPQVFIYGKGGVSSNVNPSSKQEKETPVSARTSNRDAVAQKKYRDKLLEECPYCPITKISDERLLLASHIKPYSVSAEDEAFDPKNGFILSPLYDRLFDQGFISFDEKKCMLVSNWISPSNQDKCNIKSGSYIQALPLDSEREKYMEYHRQYVFKG